MKHEILDAKKKELFIFMREIKDVSTYLQSRLELELWNQPEP